MEKVHLDKNIKQIGETFRLAARTQVRSQAQIQEFEESHL